MKKASKVNKEIERINKKLASMSLSREERNNYEFRLKAIRDEISAIDYATKKGLQKGIEQGLEQGIEQGKIEGAKSAKIEIAKEMIKDNMSVEQIQKITKLTKEEIEKIELDIKSE